MERQQDPASQLAVCAAQERCRPRRWLRSPALVPSRGLAQRPRSTLRSARAGHGLTGTPTGAAGSPSATVALPARQGYKCGEAGSLDSSVTEVLQSLGSVSGSLFTALRSTSSVDAPFPKTSNAASAAANRRRLRAVATRADAAGFIGELCKPLALGYRIVEGWDWVDSTWMVDPISQSATAR